MDGHDQETRARLLSSAVRLFTAKGFSKVTVREICGSAKANVAAINYHFGGKKGLYDEVVHAAIETMQTTTVAMREAGAGRPASEQLAAYVSVFLHRVVPARSGWIHQLMMRELADPTPALDLVLEKVLLPRLAYLKEIVAALLDCPVSDSRVERCAMSVHSQCIALMSPAAAVATRKLTKRQIGQIADHIVEFSLAGVRAVARRRR